MPGSVDEQIGGVTWTAGSLTPSAGWGLVKYNKHLAQASPGDSQGQALRLLQFYCLLTL